MIQIYRITFADGHVYVGQTVQPLVKRMQRHKYWPATSAGVSDRMDAMDYTVKVLSKHHDQTEADIAEMRAIRKEVRNRGGHFVINRGGNTCRLPIETINTTGGRRYERNERAEVRCSWCGEKKPSTEYHTDRNRSSGLASRCKSCMRLLSANAWRSKDKSRAYNETKRMCQSKRRTD